MGFWVAAALLVGSLLGDRVLSFVFRPRGPKTPRPSPGEFQYPDNSEGRPIPVVFGTQKIRDAKLVWEGDESTAPIVESGATVGYKYYAGMEFDICTGPIDELLEVQFNDKSAGATVTEANNQVVVSITGTVPWHTVEIPVGNYEDGQALALAVENALNAEFTSPGSPFFKVVFGFVVDPDRTDKLAFYTKLSGVTRKHVATLAPGRYSADAMAQKVEDALNGQLNALVEGQVTVEYLDTGIDAGKFRISFDPFGAFTASDEFGFLDPGDGLFEIGKCANTSIGFHIDTARKVVGGGGGPTYPLTADIKTGLGYITFGYKLTSPAVLRTTDPTFTSAAILGLSTAADISIGSHTAANPFQAISATYTDQGDYIDVEIDDPTFFGTEGGLQGLLSVYKGSLGQTADPYIEGNIGKNAPGYRGICRAFVKGMYLGDSNYPKPIGFVVRRCPNTLGLTGGKENIGGDANPAAIIYEALTDDRWGAGVPVGDIDITSLQTMAQTLYDEGMGLSMTLNQLTEVGEFVDDVLRHVDGLRYEDPVTGKVAFVLARPGYTVGSLPLLDRNNVLECRITRRSWDQLRNVVRVRYVDRSAGFVEKVEQLMDLAGVQARGGEHDVEEIALLGISNATNAKVAAERTLKAIGYPLGEMNLMLNRESWALRPGSLARLTWTPLSLTDVPIRLLTVDTGTLTDGAIHCEAVEDIFGVP